MEPFEIVWRAPEFMYQEKSVAWYWATILIAVALLGVAVWQRNFLFAVFAVTAEILVLVWSSREPQTVDFRLTDKGLTVYGRNFHSYVEMKSWSMEERNDLVWTEFVFLSQKRLRPALRMYVPTKIVPVVVQKLSERLPQVPWEESFLDTLEKLIGF